MKKLLFAALLLISLSLSAQKKTEKKHTPKPTNEQILTSANWDFPPEVASFGDYQGKHAMRLHPKQGRALLKNTSFATGTIEFDYLPLDPRFASFYFHWQDDQESEIFYFRTSRAGDSTAVDGIQYSPILGGVNMWDMTAHYQTGASFSKTKWNHVKLVISEKQLRVYVNNMWVPVLEIPELEANSNTGTVGFEGECAVADLVLKPGVTENLPSSAGPDIVKHDTRYIRSWKVSQPKEIGNFSEPTPDLLPKDNENWDPITAERLGLINLTRKFGMSTTRRIVWLKTTIDSQTDQQKKINLGFSDDVWVFINGLLLYVDKNTFPAPVMKTPGGRCSIDNTSFNLPLKPGKNELLIGVANNFYGWGIIARLDNLGGVSILN